jgi:hypothetical protein
MPNRPPKTYYEALLESLRGWHEARHDLRPWWEYFLGMLTAAYNEFENRVGTITTARGAKREMVCNVVSRLPMRFSIKDLQRALSGLRSGGKVKCLGRGPDARWEKTGG